VTAKSTARLVASAAEIGAARWNAPIRKGLAEPHPFTSYEFLRRWSNPVRPRRDRLATAHLLMGRIDAAFLKSHSYGEYVLDHAWPRRCSGRRRLLSQTARRCPTPVTGRRLLRHDAAERAPAAGAVGSRCLSSTSPS
jgi:predicted N-acyltransferase